MGTFAKESSLEAKFVELLRNALQLFAEGDIDIDSSSGSGDAISELLRCVEVMVSDYSLQAQSAVWRSVVPCALSLVLRVLTQSQRREGLRAALTTLARICDPTR